MKILKILKIFIFVDQLRGSFVQWTHPLYSDPHADCAFKLDGFLGCRGILEN